MSREKEKGFFEQIGELVAPIVAIIIIVVLLYVLQALVNVIEFMNRNPWVWWAVLVVISAAFLFYAWAKFGSVLPGRSGFRINAEFLKSLPIELREQLLEAQGTYRHGHYRSCSVMMRGALEAAISIRFREAGKARALHGKNLPQRIELAKKEGFITPSIAKRLNYLVKWIGDIGAHDYRVKIREEDVENGFQTLRIALEHMYH